MVVKNEEALINLWHLSQGYLWWAPNSDFYKITEKSRRYQRMRWTAEKYCKEYDEDYMLVYEELDKFLELTRPS